MISSDMDTFRVLTGFESEGSSHGRKLSWGRWASSEERKRYAERIRELVGLGIPGPFDHDSRVREMMRVEYESEIETHITPTIEMIENRTPDGKFLGKSSPAFIISETEWNMIVEEFNEMKLRLKEQERKEYEQEGWHKARCSECGKNRMVRTILRSDFCEECEHCENADC